MLTRLADIRWLIDKFNEEGFVVKHHWCGQFTELYTKISSARLRKHIHKFNNFWFNHINISLFAHGNIIIFQKMLPPNKPKSRLTTIRDLQQLHEQLGKSIQNGGHYRGGDIKVANE